MSTKNEKQTIVISATSSIGRALFKKYAAIRKRHTSPLRSPLTPSFPLSSTALSGGTNKQKGGVSVETLN